MPGPGDPLLIAGMWSSVTFPGYLVGRYHWGSLPPPSAASWAPPPSFACDTCLRAGLGWQAGTGEWYKRPEQPD